MIRLFSRTFLMLIVIQTSICVNAQDTTDVSKPLIYNELDIENNDDFSTFSLLDEVVGDYKMFFVGENHEFKSSNVKLQLKMFKYLYKNAGVRTMLIELGYSWGWLFNEYVQTGDTNIFNILETYSWKQYTDLYKGVREFNEPLPENEKVNVIGVDVERFYGLPIKTLCYLLPENDPPDELILNVESLTGLSVYNDEYMEQRRSDNYWDDYYYSSNYSSHNTIEAFVEDFNSKRALYKEYIGQNFTLFERIVKSIEDMIQYYEYESENMTHTYVYREKYMFDQFMIYLKENPDVKCYAQFGRCHTSVVKQEEACSWYDYNSFATRLNKSNDTLVKGKVCSIGCFYPEGSLGSEILEENEHLLEIVNIAEDDNLTIFKLTTDTSIFEEFTDKFKYIIINNMELSDEDYAQYDEVDEDIDIYYNDISFYFDAYYKIRKFNFSKLNDFYSDYSLEDIDESVQMYGGGFSRFINGGYCYSFEYCGFSPVSQNFNDSSKISLSGFTVTSHYGFDIIKNEIFNIIPRLGIGYGELKLIIEEEEWVEQHDGFFQENIISAYKNPAFFFDFDLHARINLNPVSFGVNIGYAVDVSNHKWKSGKLLDNSPKTSFSGFYSAVSGSIFF